MTKQEVNEIYEASVYQIRLNVAAHLMAVPGITSVTALKMADEFVALIQSEDFEKLKAKFP
jgi:pyoverdine/dityrosine biosynthesis protein Dit1